MQREYDGKTRNLPQQLLTTYHLYQHSFHWCHRQETMEFNTEATTKIDDTIIFYNEEYYRIEKIEDPLISMKKLPTKTLNILEIIKLAWDKLKIFELASKVPVGSPVSVHKHVITAKGVIVGNIIMPFYPQWVIT